MCVLGERGHYDDEDAGIKMDYGVHGCNIDLDGNELG
jgi:hypothetical protein